MVYFVKEVILSTIT